MPNPFPGMNPYLEAPRRWRMVHNGLIYCFNTVLAEQLPPQFTATSDERVYVEGWGKDYIPDGLVIQTRPLTLTTPATTGGTATLEKPLQGAVSAPLIADFGQLQTRERFIEIRTADDREELIAVVEFLSPTNKEEGVGRDQYLTKQRDLLASGVHLLEIDLLRGGTYTLAPPPIRTRALAGDFDYLISLHRGFTSARFEMWPLSVRDRLPQVFVPLTDEVPAVQVDLQAVLDRVYNDSNFDRIIRYEEEPVPPLSPDDAVWADALLRQQGRR